MEEMLSEQLDLPGFRFHPTEEELLDFYLKNMVYGKKICLDIIAYLNIYHHDPSELPGLARNGEREWYFFVPRDRRHGSGGGRPNRTTANGFWKATGSDRKILRLKDPKRIIGLRKTLVFYKGRAPRGTKTDWVMNEYRLPDSLSPLPKDIVLCKIYRKATSLKELEQRAAMEEGEMKTIHSLSPSPISSMENMSFSSQQEDPVVPIFKKEIELDENEKSSPKDLKSIGCSVQLPLGFDKLEVELPKISMDWSQDWFNSPWLQNLTQNLTPSCANILNF